MIIDCISDLHGYHPDLKGGDLLIIAGDLTSRDTMEDYVDFMKWLDPIASHYKKVVLIAGNHDNLIQKHGKEILPSFCEYLCDSGTEFEGLKIWGSPWTKTFKGMNPHCKAFTVDTEDELMDKFDLIPHDTRILITHSPPFGILDGIPIYDGSLFHAGSKALYGWLKYVERPFLHVFGHIHEGHGTRELFPSHEDKIMISVNASYVNAKYQPFNKPIRVTL